MNFNLFITFILIMSDICASNGNIVASNVCTDNDASELASIVNSSGKDSYYTYDGPSEQDEEVHRIYEQLMDIVDNPERYTEDEINDILAEIEDEYPAQHGRYDGNYKAHLADKGTAVYKFITQKGKKSRTLGKDIYRLIAEVTQIMEDKEEVDSESE